MNLVPVPPDRVTDAWPLAARHVEAAERRNGMADPGDAEQAVRAGNAILWLAADGMAVIGAGVTRIIEHRGRKACEIFAWGADDQRRCAPLLATVEAFAKAEGCATTRLVGPKGWARMLRDYRIAAMVLEKELS